MLNFMKTFIAVIASLAFLSGCGEISQQTADEIQKSINNDGSNEGELIQLPEDITEVEVKATSLGSCVRRYWAGVFRGGYRDERCIDFKVEDSIDNAQALMLSADTETYCEDELNGEYRIDNCGTRDNDFQQVLDGKDPEKNCHDVRDVSDSVDNVEVKATHILVRNNRRLALNSDDECRVQDND